MPVKKDEDRQMVFTILRAVGAVAAGIAVAFVLVIAVEMLSNAVHPFPEDFGGTHEEIARHVELIPSWVLAVAVVAWGFTAFAGTWTAGRLGNRGTAAFLGLLLLSAVILNIVQLPYPIWFKVASLIAVAAAAVYGYRLSSRRAITVTTVTD